MAHTSTDEGHVAVLSQQLLLSLAEELKLPFAQIARQAELAQTTQDLEHYQTISVVADSALRLVDNYILGVKMAQQNGYVFDEEPVSISSVLYDATAELLPIAKTYGVALDLEINGRFTPVMANRQALQAALVCLGYSLIEALPSGENTQLRLQFSAHRSRYGLVAGVYSNFAKLSAQTLQQGRRLHGYTRQPMTQLSASSGAGVFVADALLQAMHTKLTTSRHHNLRGLGVVLQANPQLQLI